MEIASKTGLGEEAESNALGDVVKHERQRDWIAALGVGVLGNILRIAVLAMFAKANDDKLWGLLNKWDAVYYTEIARAGYFNADIVTEGNVHETTMAFFPGFPLLIKLVSFLGFSEPVAAILLNFVFTVVMAAGVMAIAQRMGADFKACVAAAIVVTSAPMSIVFAMPYTEALFGALTMWALVALIDRKWLLAGLFVFALSAVRLTSVDVILVFGVIVLLWGAREWKAWVALVVSALPLLGYLTMANRYLAAAGGYFGIQKEHWNSQFDFGVATFGWVKSTLLTADHAGFLLSTSVIVGAPILLVLVWRKLPLPVWLFSAALIANVLLSDGIMHSRPRLLLPAAVLFIPWVIEMSKRASSRQMAFVMGVVVLGGAWFSAHMLAVFDWAI